MTSSPTQSTMSAYLDVVGTFWPGSEPTLDRSTTEGRAQFLVVPSRRAPRLLVPRHNHAAASAAMAACGVMLSSSQYALIASDTAVSIALDMATGNAGASALCSAAPRNSAAAWREQASNLARLLPSRTGIEPFSRLKRTCNSDDSSAAAKASWARRWSVSSRTG